MDYNYNNSAAQYAAPPAYYNPSITTAPSPPPPFHTAPSYSAPPAYYTPLASTTSNYPYSNPNPNPPSYSAAYQYQPATYPPSAAATYIPASTGATYASGSSGATYAAGSSGATFASGSSGATYAAKSGATSARYGRNPAGPSKRRPGLGFKEHDLAEKKLKMMQGGAKSDSVRVCSTCNVVCNSDKVFETHITSAKHIAKVSGVPASRVSGKTLNPKKKKKAQISNGLPKVAQSVYCDVCKITCNDLEIYNSHMAGKKHNKNIKNANMSFIGTSTSNTSNAKIIQFVPASNTSDNNINNNNVVSIETKNIAQKLYQTVAQSVYCDICQITCDTQEVFNIHLTGKKHNRKVTNQIMAAAALAAANNNNNSNLNINNNNISSNNSNNDEGNGDEKMSQNNKRKVVTKEELEVKKRKMMENGTNLECVKVCEMCNVVCSSQMVFDLHVKGKMHLSMLKNSEENRQNVGPKLGENQQIVVPNVGENQQNMVPKLEENRQSVAPKSEENQDNVAPLVN